MEKNKKILILGGNSFLGGHMFEHLKKNNQSVCATYNKNEVKRSDFFHCNLLSIKSIKKLPECNIIIMYSFFTIGKNKYINNLIMIKNIINYCIEKNIFFVFISSSIVNFKYDTDYKKSKINCEKIISKKLKNYLIIRPALPFGGRPKINSEMRIQPLSFLKKFIDNYYIVPVMGNGKCIRRPIFVDDLNIIIMHLINIKLTRKTIEIGGPDKISLNKIIDIFSNNIKKNRIKIHLPIILFYMPSLFLKFIDYENFSNFKSDEIIDNDSWQSIDSKMKKLKLNTFKKFSKFIV